ncbi:Methyl-accepting chemotaxis protein [Oxalobacteraceae bacterium IMCC9480]|nr:Methyl-accepting chemotaxis protein [Oxalobacteraceae bacterium IMCC9480]
MGINHISQAITHMDQSTQQNAALVEQSTAAAESMQEQADKLVNAISVFQVDGIQATLQPAILATPLRQHLHNPKVLPMARKASLAGNTRRQVLQAPE